MMKIKNNKISLRSVEITDGKAVLVPDKVPTAGIEQNAKNTNSGISFFKPNNPIANKKILQYPANRLSLYEQLAYNEMLDSMYKDNTIFTAYDISDGKHSDYVGLLAGVFSGNDNYGMNNQMVANIMMPRSNTDIDQHEHEFVTSEESLMSRGNQSVSNAIGSGLSTMVAGIFENISKGYFADHGEAIGTPTRATYKGAGHRTKTYSWRLSPRNPKDLISLLQILSTFKVYSYGNSHNSKMVESGTDWLKSEVEKSLGYDSSKSDVNLVTTALIDTFKYVKVMSNPTLWFIRNYNHKTLSRTLHDTSIFGPANIVNIKVNQTPDGTFQGFARFPNHSASYDVEITFREAISHTRDTIRMVL